MQCPCGMQMGSWDIKAGQVDSCRGCGRYEVRTHMQKLSNEFERSQGLAELRAWVQGDPSSRSLKAETTKDGTMTHRIYTSWRCSKCGDTHRGELVFADAFLEPLRAQKWVEQLNKETAAQCGAKEETK